MISIGIRRAGRVAVAISAAAGLAVVAIPTSGVHTSHPPVIHRVIAHTRSLETGTTVKQAIIIYTSGSGHSYIIGESTDDHAELRAGIAEAPDRVKWSSW